MYRHEVHLLYRQLHSADIYANIDSNCRCNSNRDCNSVDHSDASYALYYRHGMEQPIRQLSGGGWLSCCRSMVPYYYLDWWLGLRNGGRVYRCELHYSSHEERWWQCRSDR
jgi:hypothetical protein